MTFFLHNLKALCQDNDGATSAEYALLIALIALAIIIGVQTFGTQLNTTFSDSATIMTDAVNNAGTPAPAP